MMKPQTIVEMLQIDSFTPMTFELIPYIGLLTLTERLANDPTFCPELEEISNYVSAILSVDGRSAG